MGEEVKTKLPDVKMAVLITIDQSGEIAIQDAKQYFPDQIEMETEQNTLNSAIKLLAEQINRAEIVQEVKEELAQTFVGGKK